MLELFESSGLFIVQTLECHTHSFRTQVNVNSLFTSVMLYIIVCDFKVRSCANDY